MIRLKELEITNFRSWQHLHLTDLDKLDFVLIQGDNGAGKSSIRQAIEYLMVDTTSDSIAVSELPRNKNTECILRCILEKDNDIIEIKKYRNSRDFGNKSFVWINGENISKTDRRETNKVILNLLDISVESLFVSTVFSHNSQSFCEAKESDRKKILYDALGLSKFDNYYNKVKDRLNNIKSKITENTYLLDSLQANLSDSNKRIETYKISEKEFDKDKTKKIAKYLKQIKELTIKDTSELEAEIENLENSIQPVTDISDLKEDIENINNKLRKLFMEKAVLEKELETTTDGICPLLNITCKDLINERNKILKSTSPKLDKIKSKIDQLNDKKDLLISELEKYKNIIDNNNQIETGVRYLKYDLHTIKSSNDNVNQTRVNLETLIEETAKTKNQFTELIKKEKQNVRNLIKKITTIRQEIENDNKYVAYYNFWKTGFSKKGIPNMKSEAFLSALQFETNKVLSSISDNVSVTIESQAFNADQSVREKIAYKIRHPDKTVSDYASYSGGERQRIKLADILAFNSLIGKCNFVFLDEVLEMSLDVKGKNDILNILLPKAEDIGTLFIVSHDDTIKSAFNKVFKITKVNGVSNLEDLNE